MNIQSYIADNICFLHADQNVEEVWVNQNGPNTETVDFNPAQNGWKNFFHSILPPMTQVQNEVPASKTMPSSILFHKVGRWFYVLNLAFW